MATMSLEERRRQELLAASNQAAYNQQAEMLQQLKSAGNQANSEESTEDQQASKENQAKTASPGGHTSPSDKYGGVNSVYPDHNIFNIVAQLSTSGVLLGMDVGKQAALVARKMREQVLNYVGEQDNTAPQQQNNPAHTVEEDEQNQNGPTITL